MDAVEAKDQADELVRPVPPPGLTLVPTLRHMERTYGAEELAAAIALYGDEAAAAKADRLFRAEVEKYQQAVAKREQAERDAEPPSPKGRRA